MWASTSVLRYNGEALVALTTSQRLRELGWWCALQSLLGGELPRAVPCVRWGDSVVAGLSSASDRGAAISGVAVCRRAWAPQVFGTRPNKPLRASRVGVARLEVPLAATTDACNAMNGLRPWVHHLSWAQLIGRASVRA